VLARTIDPETGKSVVYDRSMTGLTKILERTAYFITAWKLGDYYRTYPEYVQDEVVSALKSADQFKTGPLFSPFVVTDGNLVTARYPDDVPLYAETLIGKLKNV
jgi:putative intracellular protease/amidase